MPHCRVIDLNADLGERPHAIAEDLAILQALTSANVACGFHAGTTATMKRLCAAAAEHGVCVGAHVSYRDRGAFGRAEMELPSALLREQVGEQLATLRPIAGTSGAPVRYVKPHGALYNRAAHDPAQADAVAAAVAAVDPELQLLCPPGSALADAARRHGLRAVAEGFADRAYLADRSLAPRSHAGAVLDHKAALQQGLSLATAACVTATDGTRLDLLVRSLCIHSDTPGAAALTVALRNAMRDAGVAVAAFAVSQ